MNPQSRGIWNLWPIWTTPSLFLSSTERYYTELNGCQKEKRKRDISQRANRLFSEIQCEPIPKETATHYAKLKRQAEEQGTSVAENDLWIAATALALDAILVTSDTDFQRIKGLLGLQLEDWTT